MESAKKTTYQALWLATLERIRQMNGDNFEYVARLKEEHPVDHERLTKIIPKAA